VVGAAAVAQPPQVFQARGCGRQHQCSRVHCLDGLVDGFGHASQGLRCAGEVVALTDATPACVLGFVPGLERSDGRALGAVALAHSTSKIGQVAHVGGLGVAAFAVMACFIRARRNPVRCAHEIKNNVAPSAGRGLHKNVQCGPLKHTARSGCHVQPHAADGVEVADHGVLDGGHLAVVVHARELAAHHQWRGQDVGAQVGGNVREEKIIRHVKHVTVGGHSHADALGRHELRGDSVACSNNRHGDGHARPRSGLWFSVRPATRRRTSRAFAGRRG